MSVQDETMYFRKIISYFINSNTFKNKSVLLFPYGVYGKLVEDILNDFGIKTDLILDNKLCRYNSKFKSIKDCNDLEQDKWVVVLTEPSEELRVMIKQAMPNSNFCDLFWNRRDNRVAWLENFANLVKEKNIKGNVAECGVYQGKYAFYINIFFPNKKLYLIDSFEGFSKKDANYEKLNVINDEVFVEGKFGDTNINLVKDKLLFPEQTVFIKGFIPESIKDLNDKFCFVNLDMDMYQPMLEGLKKFYPLLTKGGCILLHDYYWPQCPGVMMAVKEFERILGEKLYKLTIGDASSIAIIKI